jgi:hypothetical protein
MGVILLLMIQQWVSAGSTISRALPRPILERHGFHDGHGDGSTTTSSAAHLTVAVVHSTQQGFIGRGGGGSVVGTTRTVLATSMCHEGNDAIPNHVDKVDRQYSVAEGKKPKADEFNGEEKEAGGPTGLEGGYIVLAQLRHKLPERVAFHAARHYKGCSNKDGVQKDRIRQYMHEGGPVTTTAAAVVMYGEDPVKEIVANVQERTGNE